ncbi:hypothetical protein HELRODRAFT_74572 [Helobdella robusta]|uniref:G-protein coupled receptors family 1 profile domain-containing protein n=1 Tax=Helobdella robusta TaxID=6412 RepID=T1G1T0_HELRO|nr:hypothetical protein HELRODRAFT_74572 [Helobdella robusta]ESO09046.1 hypothetical protein HELRODRAFT_74572 [Helobdella robusta]
MNFTTTETFLPEIETEDTSWTDTAAPYILGFIFAIGFVGNGMLIFIIVANASMRSVTNLLLLSMAVGDFLVIICSLPLRILLYVNVQWTYGDSLCHLYEFLINLSLGVSIFTLTALAGDRFVAVVWPISTLKWLTKKKSIILIASTWLLAIIFALPDLITSRVVSFYGMIYCDQYGLLSGKDYIHSYQLARRLTSLIVYYVIPVILITFMYAMLAFRLYTDPSKTLSHSRKLKLKDSNMTRNQQKIRNRIAKIVLILAVCFIICWTPRYVFVFFINYSSGKHFSEAIFAWKLMTFVLSFLNSCINAPVLYFMSSDFKKFFNHYFCGLCCKKKRLGSVRRCSEIGAATSSFRTSNETNHVVTVL